MSNLMLKLHRPYWMITFFFLLSLPPPLFSFQMLILRERCSRYSSVGKVDMFILYSRYLSAFSSGLSIPLLFRINPAYINNILPQNITQHQGMLRSNTNCKFIMSFESKIQKSSDSNFQKKNLKSEGFQFWF